MPLIWRICWRPGASVTKQTNHSLAGQALNTERPTNDDMMGSSELQTVPRQFETESLPELYCPECGYNLRGISSNRCPECGFGIDYVKLRESQIPWVHRRQLGTARSYWQTVWMVMFQSKRLSAEIARPVSFREAQLFRWSTLARIYVPVLLATMVTYLFEPFERFGNPLVDWVYQNVWPMVFFHVCFALLLMACSGIPAAFFHPRTVAIARQNRAIALSYYTMAPLGWMPVAYIAAFFVYWSDSLIGVASQNFKMLGWASTMLPGVLVLWWYVGLLRLAGRTLGRGPEQLVALALALPMLWGLLAAAILIVVPCIVWYVVVMVSNWWPWAV